MLLKAIFQISPFKISKRPSQEIHKKDLYDR
nr:MAG TPA: hypothetical protein [Caudoviricetes sp.]